MPDIVYMSKDGLSRAVRRESGSIVIETSSTDEMGNAAWAKPLSPNRAEDLRQDAFEAMARALVGIRDLLNGLWSSDVACECAQVIVDLMGPDAIQDMVMKQPIEPSP